MTITPATVPTERYEIFIAGDLAQAKQVCREYRFNEGFCVTIEPTTYIYKGGEEAGIRVGLINYARYPSRPGELHDHAKALADILMRRLCQHSYSIVSPETSEWYSRRTPDVKEAA